MVRLFNNNIIFLFIFFIGCSSQAISDQDKTQIDYDNAIELYNKGKYSKAKVLFEDVVLNSRGSRIALESEFYLSESLYNLKEYEEALYGYDNYARSSQDFELIELARFRLCQCAYNLTESYKNDQTNTIDAIDKIEIFLEDYPDSKYYSDISSMKLELKYRLAKKAYESAILYMKLQEYKAALVYLVEIHNDNFEIAGREKGPVPDGQKRIFKRLLDDVKIMTIYAYLLDDRKNMAIQFLEIYDDFYDLDYKDKANELVESNLDTFSFDRFKDIYFGISK